MKKKDNRQPGIPGARDGPEITEVTDHEASVGATDKGKQKSSIFRRNKTVTDDKSKKAKKEKKEKQDDPGEKRSWSRFFSTRASKRKKQKEKDVVGKMEEPVESRDLSLQLSEAAYAPSISNLAAQPMDAASAPTFVLRQSDFTVHQPPSDSKSEEETQGERNHPSGFLHGDPTPKAITASERFTDVSDGLRPKSRGNLEADHVTADKAGEGTSFNALLKQPSYGVQHAMCDGSTAQVGGQSGTSPVISDSLPIAVLDRSPVTRRRGKPLCTHHKDVTDEAEIQIVHASVEENGGLLSSRGLSRSRLHITHLSYAIDDVGGREINSACAQSVDVESVPLELSFRGSEKTVVLGDRDVNRDVNVSRAYGAPKTPIADINGQSSTTGRDEQDVNKYECEIESRKFNLDSVLTPNANCDLTTDYDGSGQFPKTTSTQTASMLVTDATTQSTIDRRQDRDNAPGNSKTAHVVDATTQSTIDRRNNNGARSVTDATTQSTIDRREQARPGPSQTHGTLTPCPNCQALQRPCQKHRQNGKQGLSQSASRHLDSAESYLQLLSDIHRMHNTARDLCTVTPPVADSRIATSPPSQEGASNPVTSTNIVHRPVQSTHNEAHNQLTKDMAESPFVRSFRTSKESSRTQDRCSMNRGSYRKPLEKDESMKDMPVATVRPTVRPEISADASRTSARTLAARGSLRTTGASGVSTQASLPIIQPTVTDTTPNSRNSSVSTESMQDRTHTRDQTGDLRPWEIARERARERVREFTRDRERSRQAPSGRHVNSAQNAAINVSTSWAPSSGSLSVQQSVSASTVSSSRSPSTNGQLPQRDRLSTHPVPHDATVVSATEGDVYRLLGQVQDELVRIPGVLIVGVRDSRIFVTVAPSEGERRIPEVLRVLLQNGVATSQCEVGVLPQSLRRAITAFTDDDVIQRLGDHEPQMLAVN